MILRDINRRMARQADYRSRAAFDLKPIKGIIFQANERDFHFRSIPAIRPYINFLSSFKIYITIGVGKIILLK